LFLQFFLALIKNRSGEEEIRLIERIVYRDEAALSELYDLYSRILYSLVLKIVKNQEEAEDILQSVFIKIWNKALSYNKSKGSVYSWLVTLARNSAIDKVRSKDYKANAAKISDIKEVDIINDDPDYDGLNSAIANERAGFVGNALNQIPPEQKVVIELAYFEGLTQVEIAEKLNIPLGTVKTRIRQALIKLEKLLSDVIN